MNIKFIIMGSDENAYGVSRIIYDKYKVKPLLLCSRILFPTKYSNILDIKIIDNFDFSYVSKANIGEISATVDKTNNSITWNIPSLAIGQTATVQYKLKLKENFDSTIVNKILNTNEKVDTTYTDFDNKSQSKTSDVSPKLKLAEPPATLPKAGTTTFIAITVLAVGLLVFSITKLTILKNIIK